VQLRPRHGALLEAGASRANASAIGDTEATLRAEPGAPSRRWFEVKGRPAYLARLLHAVDSTFADACGYCEAAARQMSMPDLFDAIAIEEAA
jgi:hypothetical protein